MTITNAASEKHRQQMQELGQFMGAEEVIYNDQGNGEEYELLKNGARLILKIRGNSKDGGFLAVETKGDPWKTEIVERFNIWDAIKKAAQDEVRLEDALKDIHKQYKWKKSNMSFSSWCVEIVHMIRVHAYELIKPDEIVKASDPVFVCGPDGLPYEFQQDETLPASEILYPVFRKAQP